MRWFDKLECKFGKYAIPNLMYYIIILYIVGFVLEIFASGVYDYYFALNVEKVLQGQIWRLVTFIIQPPSNSLIFIIFTLYFYYMIGNVLERTWGSFKFNMYFFSGMILHVIAAFIIYFLFDINFSMNTYYINLALFMAFAYEYGDTEVLLFFIIPIKIKWLAWFDAAVFAVTIIGGYMTPFMPRFIWQGLANLGLLSTSVYSCYVLATCALVSMLNFLFFVFFAKSSRGNFGSTQTQRNYRKAVKTAKRAEKKRMQEEAVRARYNAGNTTQRNQNQGYGAPNNYGSANNNARAGFSAVTKHRCAVCGRTELDGDNLVFRYCSKCDGNYEYCQDHLYTHIHVKNNLNNSNGQNT